MRLSLRVTYNDGSMVDATATTIDLVAFEDAFNRSIISLGDEMKLKDLCWLAWTSLHRREQTASDFTAWLAAVDEVELVEEETEPAPLDRPNPSTSASAD